MNMNSYNYLNIDSIMKKLNSKFIHKLNFFNLKINLIYIIIIPLENFYFLALILNGAKPEEVLYSYFSISSLSFIIEYEKPFFIIFISTIQYIYVYWMIAVTIFLKILISLRFKI
jgi:hypothetical protein